MESDLSPILVMSTNKGVVKVRGSSHLSPHGIPVDMLDRSLIIRTQTYSQEVIFVSTFT